MEKIRNRLKKGFLQKDDKEKNFEQQLKLSFNRIQKSSTNYDSYTFKQNYVPKTHLFMFQITGID